MSASSVIDSAEEASRPSAGSNYAESIDPKPFPTRPFALNPA
jgi:hypothetical protein